MKKLTNNKTFKQITYSLLAAAVVTITIAVAGVLNRVDNIAQDAFYQSPKALDGDIVVIGIDNKSLDDLGPYNSWGRDIMAKALENLARDKENLPAVVAIDTLYIGETDKENDQRLANAAKELGNVVTASFAQIGTKPVYEDGHLRYDYNAVFSYDEPYEEESRFQSADV